MNDFVLSTLTRLSSSGESLLGWVGVMNLWTAGLFAIAFALDRLLAQRVAAAWRVALYLPMLLRLALPADVGFAIPLLQPSAASASPHLAGMASVLPATSSSTVPTAVVAPAIGWSLFAPLVYFAVLAVLAMRWRSEARRLAAVMAEATPAPAWLRGLARDFDIVEHPSEGPMLVGVRMPRLVIPRGLCERIGANGVQAVVGHEASHVRRRDPLLASALHLAVVLAWPIVALWCGAARVRMLLEIACDERALRSADADARRAYGRTLIELATGRTWTGPSMDSSLGFGGGLRERIASLRAMPHRWRANSQALAALGVTTLIVACSAAKIAEKPAAATPNDQPTNEYPQVLCMFNIMEADGPLYVSKDMVIEQGRDDGPQHFVMPSSLVAKTFDWLQRLHGYRNVATPALLVTMGQVASVELNESDKAGASVEDNRVEVRFTETKGLLSVQLSWLVGDGKRIMVPAERSASIMLKGDDVILAVLPTLPSQASTGRILMIRPSIIRSPVDRPVQTEGPPATSR